VKTRKLFGLVLGLILLAFLGTTMRSHAQAVPNSPMADGANAAPATGTGRIHPETDLVYLGAFRLPDEESNGTSWSYGGHGMGYYPLGDPAGPPDSFPGSLFSISHPYQNFVSEFTIPAPVVSPGKEVEDLPLAATLQPFADVTEGRQTGGLTGTTLGDIQYYPQQGAQTSAKLYWAMYEYYLPDPAELMFGWSELDLANTQSQGLWRLDDFPASATSKYLFEISAAWSDAYTPGKCLAAGRCRIVNNGSWGPALYAFGPWNDGDPPGAPPPDGASLDAVELLKYGSELTLRDFSHSEEWVDGAWLVVGDKSAVILAGARAIRTSASGEEYYGEPGVDGCGYKGYHAEPYYGAILFYDPYLLAQVTQGILQPDEVQPYAEFNVEDYMFKQGCRRGVLGGVGYDRQRNLLYVTERYVEGYYARKPIVHVWQVVDGGQPADHNPPGVPANLQASTITSATVELAWEAASDDVHLVGYVMYRNGSPVATTVEPSYSDDKVNPSATYTYTVQAWDAACNRSTVSDPLVVTTPPGMDTRAPIITSFRITGILSDSATVSWWTDEPATTRVRYEILYSGDWITIENPALTTAHSVVLTDLTPGKQYSCLPTSIDAAGNEYQRPGWQFSTPYEGSGGFGPVLNGIGAQRTDEGEWLQFFIHADDRDSDELSLSAADLPPGASFDSDTQEFRWLLGPYDAGVYRVTFSVSDGAYSDSEEVAVFVLDTQGGPLELQGRAGDEAIYLHWTLNVTLPVTHTWQIDYDGPAGDELSPITNIVSPTRAYTLTGLTNYVWYTLTVSAMVDATPSLSDTVRLRPTDIFLYLPLVLRE
jgi:hypothetical protein